MPAAKGGKTYKARSEVWVYPGMSGWHFVTLPKKTSEAIKTRFAAVRRGWGSLPVIVTVGKTRWRTSIFPDKRAGAYLLPLKASARKKADIRSGDTIAFSVEVDA